MVLIKLHRVLVVGGAALVASCGDSGSAQQQTATTLIDGGTKDDRAQPAADATPKPDGQGVDAWLSWATTPPPLDAQAPVEDAADATPSADAGASDATPTDAQGVDAWLSWA